MTKLNPTYKRQLDLSCHRNWTASSFW